MHEANLGVWEGKIPRRNATALIYGGTKVLTSEGNPNPKPLSCPYCSAPLFFRCFGTEHWQEAHGGADMQNYGAG